MAGTPAHRGGALIAGAAVTAVAAALAAAAVLTSADDREADGSGTATTSASPRRDPGVSVDTAHWHAWALLDIGTGEVTGSENMDTDTNSAESMIKIWIGADYLAHMEAEDREPAADEQRLIADMIRRSDDTAAQILYEERGSDAMIERLIGECGLQGTTVHPDRWALTRMTAHDAVTMMACIVHRAGASPLTTWLLDLARDVEPSNAFGIPDGLPPGTDPAVKNGWTAREATGMWHVNSLAHWDRWVLAVLTAYPEDLGQEYGAGIAEEVAAQLFG